MFLFLPSSTRLGRFPCIVQNIIHIAQEKYYQIRIGLCCMNRGGKTRKQKTKKRRWDSFFLSYTRKYIYMYIQNRCMSVEFGRILLREGEFNSEWVNALLGHWNRGMQTITDWATDWEGFMLSLLGKLNFRSFILFPVCTHKLLRTLLHSIVRTDMEDRRRGTLSR